MVRILLIDDDKEERDATRKILEEALKGIEHEIVEAADGRAGLVEFKKGNFTLVITDFKMGEMDGLEVVAAIREKDKVTPVVVFTGMMDREFGEFKDKAKKVGATEVFNKAPLIPFIIDKKAKEEFQNCICNLAESGFSALGGPKHDDQNVRGYMKRERDRTHYHLPPRQKRTGQSCFA